MLINTKVTAVFAGSFCGVFLKRKLNSILLLCNFVESKTIVWKEIFKVNFRAIFYLLIELCVIDKANFISCFLIHIL